MKRRNKILGISGAICVILAVLVAVAFLGRAGQFMCSQSARLSLISPQTLPTGLSGQGISVTAPGVENALLIIHDVTGADVPCTLVLKGVAGREKFHLSPSHWQANGGNADYWVPDTSLSELQKSIVDALSALGVQVASVNIDFEPRYHWVKK